MNTETALQAVPLRSTRARRHVAPGYSDLLDIVRITAATIDYAFGHPALKDRPSARDLLLHTLRMTILCGKPFDQITRRQQSSGVRKCNRGMQYTAETLRRSTRWLEKLGPLTVIRQPGAKWGDAYGLNVDHISNWNTEQRSLSSINSHPYPQGNGSSGGHQSYPPGRKYSKPNGELAVEAGNSKSVPPFDNGTSPRCKPAERPPHIPTQESETMREHLLNFQEGLRRDLGPLTPTTPANVLRAARKRDPAATPEDVASWLHMRIVRGVRWKGWGGLVTAVTDDFPLPRAAPPADLSLHSCTTNDIKTSLCEKASILSTFPGYEDIAAELQTLVANTDFDTLDYDDEEGSVLRNELTIFETRMLKIARGSFSENEVTALFDAAREEVSPYRKKLTLAQLSILEEAYVRRKLFEISSLPSLKLI
jgi:hypothetical protein